MGYGFKVEICGDYACFTRPELKVERVSYDVITPSAARGILEAVMWEPAIRYYIDEIAVCSQIRFENIKRNEVDFKADYKKVKTTSSNCVQRTSMVLRDVHYIVTAHFKMTEKAQERDNEGKFAEMIRRRLEKGQCFHMPYLGTREFPAKIRLIKDNETLPKPIEESRSLGIMLHDFKYDKETDKDGNEIVKKYIPTYFRAEMKHGIINLRNVEVLS